MNSPRQLTKVELIEKSLRCHSFAVWSWLPIIGFVLVMRVWMWLKEIDRGQGTLWNPAEKYLNRSMIFLGAGVLVNCLLCLLISVCIISAY